MLESCIFTSAARKDRGRSVLYLIWSLENNNNNRDADFPLFSGVFFSVFLARSVLYFLLFHLSLSERSLFFCSFSVRWRAHVDFQLFSQKSSGVPVIIIIIIIVIAFTGAIQDFYNLLTGP